jgi:phosphate transport system substrate-binding protein
MSPAAGARWLLAALALLALALLALAACGTRSTTTGACGLLTLAGSTSVEPFAEKLAENYMALHPAQTINVQGGGSSAGVMAVTSGACQIGMSSRELKPDERGQVAESPIALDGIAVIVNRDNPLRGLSLEQVRAVFAGWVTNWRDLGLPLDHSIDTISREEGSGTAAWCRTPTGRCASWWPPTPTPSATSPWGCSTSG